MVLHRWTSILAVALLACTGPVEGVDEADADTDADSDTDTDADTDSDTGVEPLTWEEERAQLYGNCEALIESNDDSDSFVDHRRTEVFNEDGLLATKTHDNDADGGTDTVFEWTYNEDNRPDTLTGYDGEGSLLFETQIHYQSGLLTQEDFDADGDGTWDSSTYLEYGDDDRVSRTTADFNLDGTLDLEIVHTYTVEGDVTVEAQVIDFGFDGAVDEHQWSSYNAEWQIQTHDADIDLDETMDVSTQYDWNDWQFAGHSKQGIGVSVTHEVVFDVVTGRPATELENVVYEDPEQEDRQITAEWTWTCE